MYITTNTQPKCSVNITTKRNRVKEYDGKVYLKDGQKFELEIFNPHNFKVMAKIKFNGQYISASGIVLKPGQRIYLERYLDSNNAFLFNTYDVDGTADAMKAIAENGNVEVEFHSEQTIVANWSGITYQSDYYFPSTGGGGSNFYNGTINCSNTLNGVSTTYSTSNTLSVETGSVDKGGETNQNFDSEYGIYNYISFEKVSIKMLPISAKPAEVSEIRNYCTGCGTRIKKATWKFCPSCGEKF
jgi:hypothetical protein